MIKSLYFFTPPQTHIHAIESDDNASRHNSVAANLDKSNGLTLAIPKNDSFSDEVHYRKHPRPLSNIESKASPSLMIPRPYNRVASYQPSISGMSTGSHSETDQNIPPPSTEKEKSKHTR